MPPPAVEARVVVKGAGPPEEIEVPNRLDGGGVSQRCPAQPPKQEQPPPRPRHRPCPLQLTTSSHAAPHRPPYHPAAHDAHNAPESCGPHAGQHADAADSLAAQAGRGVSQRVPTQPAKQMQGPSAHAQRPRPLQFTTSLHCRVHPSPNHPAAQRSQSSPTCSGPQAGLGATPPPAVEEVLATCAAVKLQRGPAQPSKQAHDPLSHAHRPCALQLATSSHRRSHRSPYSPCEHARPLWLPGACACCSCGGGGEEA
jgi:hypothetical protein